MDKFYWNELNNPDIKGDVKMMRTDFFSRELTFGDFEAIDSLDLIRKAYPILLEKSKVKPSFLDAILAREIEYPTGLPTVPFGVAIPHGNTEHVIEPCMMLIRPRHPVKFHEMGNDANVIYAHFIVLMCLKEEKSQIGTLSRLMELFMNSEFMNALLGCKDAAEIFELFYSSF